MNTSSGRFEALAPGVGAWIASKSTWGYSNSGLVTHGGESVLIDTLMDPRLTATMLDAIDPITSASPVTTVVNTHSDGDHWFGNQLLDDADIWATETACLEMSKPSAGTAWLEYMMGLPDRLGDFGRESFGGFALSEVVLTRPGNTFTGRVSLPAGESQVDLVDFGTAHSPGDAGVLVPESGVAFAGDLLFFGSTPVVWTGSLDGIHAALDFLLTTGCEIFVPGHGPIGGAADVRRVRNYYDLVLEQGSALADAGVPLVEAAERVELGRFAEWAESERIFPNLATVYRSRGVDDINREQVLRMMVEHGSETRAAGGTMCSHAPDSDSEDKT